MVVAGKLNAGLLATYMVLGPVSKRKATMSKEKIICSAMNCNKLADRNIATSPFCIMHVIRIKSGGI